MSQRGKGADTKRSFQAFTIKEMARLIAFNPSKLKTGFKKLSAWGYINTCTRKEWKKENIFWRTQRKH